MTLNQVDVDVDEDEEEVDHQDTDIKPLGETFHSSATTFPSSTFPSSTFLITSFSQDGGAPVLLMSEPVF